MVQSGPVPDPGNPHLRSFPLLPPGRVWRRGNVWRLETEYSRGAHTETRASCVSLATRLAGDVGGD